MPRVKDGIPRAFHSVVTTLLQDLRYALRILIKSPGFTLLAVLSLALGIGANAAMFSILSAVLIRPLPFPDSGRLVQATNNGYYPPGGLVDLQQESRTMDVAGYSPGLQANLTGHGEAWHVTGSQVSANLFTVLGVGVELGRTFSSGEDQAGKDHLIVLSHRLWQDKFDGDAGIVGQMITLGGVDRQVVGVMPPGFAYPDAATQFWIPLHLDPRDANTYWGIGFMPIVARLRDGATLAEAQSEIQSLSHRMIALFPYPMGRNWNAEATVVPLQQFLVSDIRNRLVLLQCAIGLVLLIACANVASLLLARATSRQTEMALRAALGAGRGRIVRQLLTESVALALAGGVLGIELAYAAFSVLKLALPAGMSGLANVEMGWQVLAFVTALSVATGLAFGLAPALSASHQGLTQALKAGARRATGTPRARVRSALIAGEVALAVVLAVSAGLLIKSLWRLAEVNPGFQPERLITLRVSPGGAVCSERERCVAFYDELLRRTRGIPGVYDVAAANTVPLSSYFPSFAVQVEGHPLIASEHTAPLFWGGAVTPEYFRLMHISVVAGRGFEASDGEKSAPVIIVSAATARHYWPGENPIGKHIRQTWQKDWRTVVGVAADVRQYDLAGHGRGDIEGALYMPYAQSVDDSHRLPEDLTLLVRTSTDPTGVANRVSELVRDLNPNVPVSEIRTMETLVDDSTQQSRSLTWLFVAFAGAALTLAAIGTFGVVSYSTAQRTYEFGLRLALGATRWQVFSLVLRQSLNTVLAGLAVGVGASLVLTRLLSAFLYGTTNTDPGTFVAVGALLMAMALVAGFVPARRATKVDPMVALRYE